MSYFRKLLLCIAYIESCGSYFFSKLHYTTSN